VLIVEDNPDGRISLQTLLTLWGYSVEVASDGAEGIAKALQWHPDVALVDIGLPVIDGNEVAHRIRDALNDDVFLVAITAYAQPEDRRRAFESGFDAFLCKPADLEQLAYLLMVS
jgi:CheY-like chemotaxis protein